MSHTFSHDEIIICDGAVLPITNNVENENSSENGEHDQMSSKLALLFDTGRMQFLDLSLNWNGEIEDEGEFDIDLSSSISFPTEGAMREQGEDVDRPFSTETSLGDGSNLVFLHQSGLLLYKCSSSCLLALILDSACKVVGSFELLPHTITATMIGNENEGSPLRGPYTHYRASIFFLLSGCL